MKLLKTYTKKWKFLPNGTGTPAGPETPSADRAPAEGCRCGGHQPLEPRDPVQHERARSGGPVGGGGAHSTRGSLRIETKVIRKLSPWPPLCCCIDFRSNVCV